MSAILPPKKDVALALLEKASVFVHLDPRGDEVMVPAWLKKQPQLVLQVGLNMAVKIPDLEVAESSVSCTLSFSRRPCFCYVPWSAVYALVGEDGRGMVWPEDIPAEVGNQSQSAGASPRGALRAVSDSSAERPSGTKSAPFSGAASRIPLADASTATEHPSLVALESKEPQVEAAAAVAVAESSGDSRRSPSERPYLRLIK